MCLRAVPVRLSFFVLLVSFLFDVYFHLSVFLV